MHEIFDKANTIAIVDDAEHWAKSDRAVTSGMPLLVDFGGSFADTRVHMTKRRGTEPYHT